MKVFDLHSDLFTDIAFRKEQREVNVFDRLHYPALKQGGVTSIVCVFWTEPIYRKNPLQRFTNILSYVLEDLAESKYANVIPYGTTSSASPDDNHISIYLGIEGLSFAAQQLEEIENTSIDTIFESFKGHDIQHAILAWNERNAFASGTGAESDSQQKRLTSLGEKWVKTAAREGVVIDVSHLDERSFWDVINTVDVPILASHSNAMAICSHERNLTDAQLLAIAKSDGLIGLNAYGEFVDEFLPTVDRFIDHAVHIKAVVGVEHLAFGFDFIKYLAPHDIGGGLDIYTAGLEEVTQVPALLTRMRERGFTEAELEAISYQNAERFMTTVLGEGGHRK